MAAASKSVVSDPNATDTWPKWQVALAIGAPLAVVIGGVWAYRRSKRKGAKSSPKKQDGKDNTASHPNTGKDTRATPSPTKPASVPEEEQTPLEKAQAEKNKGNKYFKGTRYDQAITCYTQAIRMCPPGNKADLATFYHNRAAAYEKLRNNKMVVEDCTTALELNNRYVKALTRRAAACEQLEDLSQALEDVTALCILEGFQNPASLQTADRVLKNLGQTKTKEAFRNRKPAMPSKHFIRTYFAAFVNDPILNAAKKSSPPKPAEDDQVTNGEADVSPYQQALWKITVEDYDDIVSLCTQELGLPDSQSKTEATLLRATLYLLCNQYDLALADLKVVLSEEDIPKRLRVNAMLKRGSIYIQMEKQTEGLDDFASAVRMDPENADIYHHRGHHNIQLERIDDALRDLENAISKDPTFAASHVQKSFAEHKRTAMQMMGSNLPLPQAVLQSYKANVDMFPTNGDARALYAQALGDAGKFEEAEVQFAEAVRLDPDNATALVHRGLLKLQADKDIKEATSTINTALELDNRCEYAYEVLGTLEVQQGHMDKAMVHFQKAIEYSRTESEMAHLFSLLEAAKAQLNVAKNFGIQLPSFGGGAAMV